MLRFILPLLFLSLSPSLLSSAERAEELFIMAIPGTFYRESVYGGDPISNFLNPMPTNYGVNHNNHLFSLLAEAFSYRSDVSLQNIYPVSWGGANRDLSYRWQNDYGRKDMIDLWVRELVERSLDGGERLYLILGFSHGNQTAKMILNRVAEEYPELLERTIYIAFSQPNRADSRLKSEAAERLLYYINIYNVYDKVAGKNRMARLDLVDDDGNGFFNTLNELYSSQAVNFEIVSTVKVFIKSHCYPLSSEELISTILESFIEHSDSLGAGDRVAVYPGDPITVDLGQILAAKEE